MTITTVFDPPQPSDSREVFDQKAFDTVSKLNAWSSEANQTATDINADKLAAEGAKDDAVDAKDAAEDARDLAQSSATTAVSAKNDAVDAKNLAEAAKDAAEDAAEAAQTWDPENYVPLAGGVTMTGPLEVPAGASGSQVPRASEVALLTGAAFTGPITVPAGATGTEAPQAQEIFGKNQSWQTVTRTSGVTYTNSTGKPIIVVAFGTSNNVTNALSGTVSGAVAVWSSWEASGTDLNITFMVPPGSTYVVTALGVASYTVKEYR